MSLGRAPASPPGRTCPPSRQFADIGGEQRLPNCDQFQAGGFLQLSGMRTGQLPWRSLTSGRLVADCQLIGMLLLKGVFVGVSLEVCKVAQANADEFADRLTHSRSGAPPGTSPPPGAGRCRGYAGRPTWSPSARGTRSARLWTRCAGPSRRWRIGFSNASFSSPRHPEHGRTGGHTAPDALESVFGCRLRSAGELLGIDGPAHDLMRMAKLAPELIGWGIAPSKIAVQAA